MSRAQNLFRLQQIDSTIDQADIRIKEIKALLSDNANLRKASALAARAEQNLVTARKEQLSAETKVKDQRIKIEQVENTLYSGTVRNPKELQDMQNEVAALKRFLETLEERQLEAMLVVDDYNEQWNEAQKVLKKYQAHAEKQQTALTLEREQILSKRADSLQQRQQALNSIIQEDLIVYNRLRKIRAGVAVAKVED
ncbi:MAG: zinc ribbon domain-containing protein, partial [Anaerolineales bacterium]